MKIDQVLNEYRRGDADKRISLCLYYREFRDEFNCIERDDPVNFETSQQVSPPSRLLSAILLLVKKHIPQGKFFSS